MFDLARWMMIPAIDMQAATRISSAIGGWDQGASCLAALAVAVDPDAAEPLRSAAREVMAAAGLREALAQPEALALTPAQLRGIVASPLLQGAALVNGSQSWGSLGDAVLIAQGEASGSAAALFARFVLPQFPDLAERLAAPGARMLDVGTGIGALAVGFAQAFPHLQVTGIDVLPRVLELARARVQGSQVADRVALRCQDVADLTEDAVYDMVWVPAPFVPQPALTAGIARIFTALRPGGLVMIGHGTFEGDDLPVALTRFKTVAYGGTPLDATGAATLLQAHGLTSVRLLPTAPGAPAVTVGRR
jgi:protein-L-isoaspartate O-methyltransferase